MTLTCIVCGQQEESDHEVRLPVCEACIPKLRQQATRKFVEAYFETKLDERGRTLYRLKKPTPESTGKSPAASTQSN